MSVTINLAIPKTLKRSLLRYALKLVLLLILLGHSTGQYSIGLIERLDAIIYDARLRLTMPGGTDERIVIVDIDEKSLAEQGRWPWSRDRLAHLIDKLFDQQGARAVGFDVVFAEPDVSSGIKALDAMAVGALRGDSAFRNTLNAMRTELDYDARFAASLRDRKVILGYYFSSNEGGQSSGMLPAPVLTPEDFALGAPPGVASWKAHGANLPVLQEVAAGAGHFNPLIDFDGISRRVPLIAKYQGNYYESLSLAIVRALHDFPPVMLTYAASSKGTYTGIEWLDLPTEHAMLRMPVDEHLAMLIPYRGHTGSFTYVSATDVLNDRLPVASLKDKIVLVGTTAPGLFDLRATPVSAAYPGVEIHANLIAGMLDNALKHKPQYLLAADAFQILVAGLLLIFLLPRLSPLKATMLGLSLLLVLIALNFSLWQEHGLVMPLASVLLLATVLYAIDMSWGYFVESRNKRLLTELFGQYVPPELVDEMAKNPEGYCMSGKKAELSVLFSDVRGFTTISERLQPDELADLMNEYLGTMTKVVRHHRGTLDKYIGDAIMAFWGAPVDDPDHAYHAVETALGMQQALTMLNPQLAAKGWPELKIGVGINTGVMTVGDMGSPVRKAYTVMGDAVNLGSRLEGITKQYGVGIIVGEDTREKLGERVILRELDRVRVKGKTEPVGIYEPLGLDGDVDQITLEQLELWRHALQSYRAQDWSQAEALLQELILNDPHDLYDLYMKRIARYREEPPNAAWDGVTTFETK